MSTLANMAPAVVDREEDRSQERSYEHDWDEAAHKLRIG